MDEICRSSLGYSNVNEKQKVISFNDVLAVLPTGFGKTLLLRLACIQGVMDVVSP